MLKSIFIYLKNKYILITLLFFIWILFFDRNNVFYVIKKRRELKNILNEQQYYNEQIKKNKELIQLYSTNIKALEEYARENYLMKKDDEDIYIVVYE